MEYEHSPVQRQSALSTSYTNDHSKNNLTSSSSVDLNRSNEQGNGPSMVYRTKHPNFLPEDFTTDECEGVTEQTTGFLNEKFFHQAETIAKKYQINPSHSFPILNEDEMEFLQ